MPTIPRPTGFDMAQLSAEASVACEAAFPGYVGRALAGSRYVTFAVVPGPDSAPTGDQRIVCLVARADGQWMDHPARASGE